MTKKTTSTRTVFTPGDRVRFEGRRGRKVEGTIAGFKYKCPGKRKAKKLGFGHLIQPTEYAVIAMDDGHSYWEVAVHNLTKLKEGTNPSTNKAEKTVANVKYQRKLQKFARKAARAARNAE